MNIYEMYGYKSEELELSVEHHQRTFTLLKNLKSGKVKIEDIEIDDKGWHLKGEKNGK